MTSNLTHGADPDRMQQLAGAIDDLARSLGTQTGKLGGTVHNLSWTGTDATRFRKDYDANVGSQFSSTAKLLASTSQLLRAQATEQMGASKVNSSVDGGDSALKQTADRALSDIENVLTGLGISQSLIQSLLALFKADPALAAQFIPVLKDLASDGALLDSVKAAGKVLNIVSAVTTAIKDAIDHPNLAVDDRIVHALGAGGAEFAVSAGVPAFTTWALAALGSVIPGAGTAAGAATGEVIGPILGTVVSMMFDHFHGPDAAGDALQAAYDFAKADDFDPVKMGEDLAKMGIDAVGDAAKNIAVGTTHVAESVVSDVWSHATSLVP